MTFSTFHVSRLAVKKSWDEAVSLHDELEEALKLVTMKACEKKQVIVSSLPDDLPKLSGDKRAVRQIWLNLLSNAIKFTQAGGRIEMTATRHLSGDIALSVRDNGPGMPDAEVRSALGAFTRGSMATRQAIDGAGLGLSIVNGLAKIHGGTIRDFQCSWKRHTNHRHVPTTAHSRQQPGGNIW